MKLRLVSYNIHRAIGTDRRFRPQRVAEILGHYDADLVLLQEVDEGVPRSRELDLAEQLAELIGLEHFAVGHNVSLRKGRYGNATLSRFPIVRERNIDLTIGRKKRRGCQHTSVEIRTANHRPLEVFNLHLGLSAMERQRQVGKLAHSRELARLDLTTPCIVGGDFNDWRSLLRAFFIEGLGFDCATDRRVNGRAQAIKTYPAFSPQGGLDRVYYRGPIRFERLQRSRMRSAKVASDHLPLIVDFEV